MRTLLTALILAAAASTHPATQGVPPAQVPNAQVPTAQRSRPAPQAILVKKVTVGMLTFDLPNGWIQQGNRFSPSGAPAVSVTISDATPISSDFRSWFAQRAGEIQGGNSDLPAGGSIETPKQGFTLLQIESHSTPVLPTAPGRNVLFAAADLGNGQVQTITYDAPDRNAFANWKPFVDGMLTTLSR